LKVLIVTNNELRGSGTTDDAYRRVTEVWTLDGEKVAEQDPDIVPDQVRQMKAFLLSAERLLRWVEQEKPKTGTAERHQWETLVPEARKMFDVAAAALHR